MLKTVIELYITFQSTVLILTCWLKVMSSTTSYKIKLEGIFYHNFTNKEFIDVLRNKYYDFLISNYGPQGSMTIIRNCAGRDFFTSSSQIIVQQLQFLHPCLKFVNALIDAQNKLYSVHGLYVGILCSGLLHRFLALQDTVPYPLIKQVSDLLIERLLVSMTGNMKNVVMPIEISKLENVLSIVRSIFYSKITRIILSAEEQDHLCMEIVRLFTKTIPINENSSKFSHVHISTIEGPSTLYTKTFEGILYREPDFSIEELEKLLTRKLQRGTNLRLVLFTVPLSIDLAECKLIQWVGCSNMETNYNDYIVNRLSYILKENQVSIIACQKFIAPSVKYELEKDNFIVMERLGTRLASCVIQMTHCIPITDLTDLNCVERFVGHVEKVGAVEVENKTFLHMTSEASSQVLTLVLTGINRHINTYQEEVVESCLHLLQHGSINDFFAVAGAGCFEAVLAFKIVKLMEDNISEFTCKMNASSASVSQIMQVFVEIFLSLAVRPKGGGKTRAPVDFCVDSYCNHLWLCETNDDDESTCWVEKVSEKCSCQMVEKSRLPEGTQFKSYFFFQNPHRVLHLKESLCPPEEGQAPIEDLGLTISKECIVDYWPAKRNAVRMAFEGFVELFTVGDCIFDR